MKVETSGFELKELRAHQEEAIEQLVHTYTQPLLAAARGMGCSVIDAEELVQETFVAFLTAVDRFQERSQLKTFLFGILYNKAREMRRHQKREEPTHDIEVLFEQRADQRGMILSSPPSPEEAFHAQELAEWIEACAADLPLPQRAAFYLKEVDGEPTEQICKILDISVTHLGVLLFRARNTLRVCLKQKMGAHT